ncbi:adhesion G-protein coupled receptor D1-like isoform X3 [Pecten maximus]|uniref:adhesion G-protein coupled receptor D1-like isoform X3 n=1 Tax=Pecten maximus TaxID=6579 RepID=UPI0014581FC1|nr:adhesion G-protein coupled receptor D1-like isoform X3 [Pecten maximus]
MVSMLSLSTGTIQVDNTTQENFVGIIDDMLSINNEGSWAEVDEHNENKNSASAAGSLLTTVETFGTAVAKSLDTGESVNLVKDNIVIQIKNTNESSIAFIPNGTTAGSGIDFSLAENDLDNVTFTAALYKTMGTLLQNTRSSSGFTSEVLALSINGQDTSNLSSPVTLTFDTDILMQQNNLMGQTTVDCVFWNDIRGWLSEGCSWVNDTCRCTHLTNFAVIISPVPASDAYVLRIISFVGCILSVLSTVTTIVVYIKLWRYLKSDRSRLLLNLCAALTIAYVLFLVGIDQTEDNTVCTIMAALLHYFFLATFCLMLAEGIQLLISVTFVFHAESKLKWLLLIGWGIPLVIVGVTVGITYDNGYHANDYCWLSLSNGVIYSFVGPAVCIIMVNVIVIFCVMKALFSSKFIATKTEKQKIFAGVRSVTVLLPVLGVTWLFGIISVNNDLIVFQYMFAVTNSLQGFFIFLFYCVFNVSVRRALEKKMKRFEFRTQTSKTGSRIQMMKTKSTDSGKMKDEGRAMKEFPQP